MNALLRDFRYGIRSLRKSPALVAVATLALTLGIGLTTTMFSIVYGALLRGLPYEGADRIVMVRKTNLQRAGDRYLMGIRDYHDFLERQKSFEGIAAYYPASVNVSGTDKPERHRGAFVTANTFRLLGVQPLLGRVFRDGEEGPSAEKLAVISYDMWQSRYGSDARVIGSALRANGIAHTIIGVMPEAFAYPDVAHIWLPLTLDPLRMKRGGGQGLRMMAKLNPGVSLDRANVELAGIARELATEFKETNEHRGALAVPFVESEIGARPRRLLYTMLGAVFLVLLIACANVANLLLDRAAHRTKEVGIRTALGASRMAVVRQFLTESFVLSAAGAALGVGIAYVGVVLFNRAIVDTQPPYWIDIRLHPPVLAFVAAIAVLSSLVSGAIPAYQSSRADINEILKDESRGASSFRIGRLSRSLVILEIALSCGLLVAAGLMIRSVVKIGGMNPGFASANVFTARVGFPASYTDTVKQARFFEELQVRLAAIPVAQSVALTSALPGLEQCCSTFAVEGATYTRDEDYPEAGARVITPAYFPTFSLPVVQGRNFGPGDRGETMPVAIVDQAFVRKHLGGKDPVGRRVRFGGRQSTQPWRTIVGVVPAIYSGDPERQFDETAIYTPLAQTHSSFVSIAVRTAGAPLAITANVRDVVTAIDSDIPIYFVYTLDEAMARPFWFIRVFGTLFMIFGLVALILAAVGLYAVMAFSVSRRTREVGIRMALGARPGHVVRMIFRQGFIQMGIGLVAGLALAAGVSQLMTILLFDVPPRDPLTFGSVVIVLGATGLLACYVPARRATRVDPLVALRAE